MKKFNEYNLTQEFTAFIREWVKLLSEGKYEESCKVLDEDSFVENGMDWNCESLREIFLEYSLENKMPFINNPYQMDLLTEKVYFYQYDDGSGYTVEYDIPLNGQWSDLTAIFHFIKNGELFLVTLYDIHVL